MSSTFDFSDILSMPIVNKEHTAFIVEKTKDGVTYLGDHAVSLALYHFNIIQGKALSVKFDFGLSHVAGVVFKNAIMECFYGLEKKAIEDTFKSFPGEYTPQLDAQAKTLNATEDAMTTVKDNIRIINARLNLMRKYCARYDRIGGFGVTVETIVAVLRNETLPESIKGHVESVKKAITDIDSENNATQDNDAPASVAQLRVALDGMSQAIWQACDSDGVMPYVYHCNKTMTLDVWRVVYCGRKYSKDNKVVRASKYTLACRELVLAMLAKLAKDNATTKDNAKKGKAK